MISIKLRNYFVGSESGLKTYVKSYVTALPQAGDCVVKKGIFIACMSIPTLSIFVAGHSVIYNDCTKHFIFRMKSKLTDQFVEG